MNRSNALRIPLTGLLACLAAAWTPADAQAAETLSLVSGAYGITGQAAATVIQGPFMMSLAAGPTGALLNDVASAGLGVDSSPIPGVTDSTPLSLNRLSATSGSTVVDGQMESVTFSFNRSGVICDLLFDGLKDETLEYFRLDLPGGGVRTYFDFEVELRLTQQGFSLASLSVPNVTLAADASDDALQVNLPFQSGDVFTLTYGEHPFPPGYVPLANGTGNGARWEGLILIPEPDALALGLLAVAAVLSSRRAAHRR